MKIARLRACIRRERYEVSLHAEKERYQEDIDLHEIEQAILKGDVIEDYPQDPRGPSCLILGYVKRRPIHIVCGILPTGWLRVITVYTPKPPKWITPRKRGEH